MHRFVLLAPLFICAAQAMAAPDFVGAYAPGNWSTTGILAGIADVDLASSSSSELVLTYDVDLGYPGGGVSLRTALYQVIASADGEVTFDWDMVYDARIHQPNTELYVYAEGPTGAISEVLLHSDVYSFGTEVASGVSPTVQVYAGRPFGIRAGGGNLDADSRISGTVTLTQFLSTDTADCAGTPGGSAVFDMCGTCDTMAGNDCVQDCRGDWGGTAVVDSCGTCDSNPSNDCAADCNGVFGGLATVDMCGTCDTIAGNDCTQDCAGAWGGGATVDGCGTCDSNPSNDCITDCTGIPGGSAVQDMCGTCDSNPNNDCEEDCAGVWGGVSEEDGCGDCDADPSNDCEADCNGDYGGMAYIDDCGICVEGNTGEAPCEPTTEPTTTGTGTTSTGTTSTTTPGTISGTDAVDTGETGDTGESGPSRPVTYTRTGCGCTVPSTVGGSWLALILTVVAARRR